MRKILLLFLLSFFVVNSSFAQQSYKTITVEDLWKYYSFYQKSVYGLRSMNDGLNYTTFDKRKQLIIKHSYKTGDVVDTLLKIKSLQIPYVSDYHFNGDETKILLETDVKDIYRHSYTAKFYIWDISTKKLLNISDKDKQQLATISPDGSKVAFVYENNIYVKDFLSGEETAVTVDGAKNKIINGAPDWVYEEEFGFNQAFYWSPDGKKIAYVRFDESKVETFDMTMFAGMSPKLENNVLYPEHRQWKYPKAGDANSVVSVHIYDVQTAETIKADIGSETDIYIPRIRWTKSDNRLGIIRLNRLQNRLEVLFADAGTGNTNTIYTDNNKYYIGDETYDDLTFLKDGKHFIITSERDGYRHIYLYKTDGTLVKQLTKGNWDVTSFIGFDDNKKICYYTSAEESPLTRQLYSVNIKGKKKKITTQEGTNRASFSSGYKYFINNFSSISQPTYVTLHNAKGKLIRVLEDNKALSEKVKEYGGVNKEFFKFKTTEGVELNGYMVKPADFDKNKKYPVLMYQYSGPDSQSATNKWAFDWHMLLTQKGYLVVCVDGRGTGGRGEEFRKMTYLQLGKYETIDQIETAKYLGTLAYVDAKRVGIWGWSYGGFETLLAMTKGADYFKAGIAVAPVTNWRYYDNIYTERFMRTPQENPSGYDDNSPINHVEKLKGKLLLVHGMGDDNVHLQNSAEISEALVQANKQFQQFYYTNRNHGIYGGNTRLHLYTMMTNFILENL
ncbi:MAG: S9 family peptidase [Bacteroidetes bacterium 4572_117]|nr:MAG: S9 family peptidase [Bacteroidetes bacterium 4572_117]